MTAVAIIEASTAPKNDGDSDVALAASGDRQAFERLYRQHVNRVFSLCARMVADRLRAEELTQDVFVRAWEKLHLFRGESSFGTWLHRMTVNVVLNARKSESRRQSRFEDSEEENGGVDAVASSRTSGTVGMPLPPGYTITYSGQAAQGGSAFGDIFKALGVAVLLMYLLMLMLFK